MTMREEILKLLEQAEEGSDKHLSRKTRSGLFAELFRLWMLGLIDETTVQSETREEFIAVLIEKVNGSAEK